MDTFGQMIPLLTAIAVLQIILILAVIRLARRKSNNDIQPIVSRLESAERMSERLERSLRDDFARQREELADRLEQVHQGLGEMRTLAAGVGDLKRVLSNVKVRGTWGEVQLGNLLEQMLTPAQYAKNVATRGEGNERVEFAIRLPGRENGDGPSQVWLPIDAKFPIEDYDRLTEALDAGDTAAAEYAAKQLEVRVRQCARDIADKYVLPPATTDFAIMFLPTEGLFAEVLRRPGLADLVQRDYRVAITGPTTLAALLNSLQMGFRTFAIEQRSSEVWTVLGEAKTEFRRYSDVLDRIRQKLVEATTALDAASVRTRAIERKLQSVEEIPLPESEADGG